MRQYIHEVYYLDSGKSFGIIVTKTAFKKAMLKHYFEHPFEDPPKLAFSLKESSNTSHYQVIPYINRRGNRDICFVKVRDKKDEVNSFYEL